VSTADELRVLIATDVLSEGQNLQDCAIVVNFDLPWAIIRLVQRAGRVDRIGQQAEEILVNEVPIIPLFNLGRVYLSQPELKGWYPNILDEHPYKFVSLEKT
jgi:superfamily II DNA/RNA helicase